MWMEARFPVEMYAGQLLSPPEHWGEREWTGLGEEMEMERGVCAWLREKQYDGWRKGWKFDDTKGHYHSMSHHPCVD